METREEITSRLARLESLIDEANHAGDSITYWSLRVQFDELEEKLDKLEE